MTEQKLPQRGTAEVRRVPPMPTFVTKPVPGIAAISGGTLHALDSLDEDRCGAEVQSHSGVGKVRGRETEKSLLSVIGA